MSIYPLQPHIHLSSTLGGLPESAPNIRWPTSDRMKEPQVIMSIDRALSGKLHLHVLKKDGLPVKIINYQYILVVRDYDGVSTEDRVDMLINMLGTRVYLCDNYHPNNGVDHTSAVTRMVLSKLGEFKVFSTDLNRYYVEIDLEDDHI